MPRYAWQESDRIRSIEVRENRTHRYALLEFRNSQTHDDHHDVCEALQRRGMTVIPVEREGKPLLRVRGFKKDDELFRMLESAGVVRSPYPSDTTMLEGEDAPKRSEWQQFVKERSIQLAGATYLIADMMPVFSGIVRKSPTDVRQGLTWASTSVMLLLFGRKNPETQMGNLYEKMNQYFAEEGIELPQDSQLALSQLKTNPSYLNSFVNFLYENPILVNNSFQGWGGMEQLRSGITQKNAYRQLAGSSVAAGMWGGLIIPENKFAGKSRQEQIELKHREAVGEDTGAGFETRFVDNPVAWIQEKPLRLSAIGPIIGNVLTGMSAVWDDRHRVNQHFGIASKKHDLNPLNWVRDYSRSSTQLLEMSGHSATSEATQQMLAVHRGSRFTAVSPVFNIMANVLYGMSSKEERSVDLSKEGYLDELLDVAAGVYAQLDAKEMNGKVMRFSGFLSTQPDININQREISDQLLGKIDRLRALQPSKPTKPAKVQHPQPTSWHEKVSRPAQEDEPQQAVGI